MPGFCFSPAMINQTIHLVLKASGTKVSGIAVEVNPAEIVLKHPKNGNLIRINRDEVEAYTGFDDVQRRPDPIRLHITRCFNMTTRCNGVKKISIDPLKPEDYADCPAKNEYCAFTYKDFFELQEHVQTKLLDGVMVGEYPQKMSDIEEDKEDEKKSSRERNRQQSKRAPENSEGSSSDS